MIIMNTINIGFIIMTGGLIQLVAYGEQDLYITNNPQITFFKIVYRRHTNFSTEVIPQIFQHKPDFGKKVSCIITKSADLVGSIYLVTVLPRIPKFLDECGEVDELAKFAWVRKVGYALIKEIEIEIGDELIDRHYSDWLNIWDELTLEKDQKIEKMIGDVKILTEPTNGKDAYKLFIPLRFWFNRMPGMAIPLINLQYNHVKINIEFNDIENLVHLSPTHCIHIDNDFVNFKSNEYIEQTVNGEKSIAKFVHFDIINRKLYLQRVSGHKFLSLKETDPNKILTEEDIDMLLYEKDGDGNYINGKYFIKGLTSQFEAMPYINAIERKHINKSINLKNLNLKKTFLLVDYIYLDEQERINFMQSHHEYLIEQLQFTGEKTITGIHQSFKLEFTEPCKELIWVTQLLTAIKNNDHFNYTDSLIRVNDKLIGENIIRNETILFNGLEVLSFRDFGFFNWVQPYIYHTNAPSEGINVYSFSIYPQKNQPSGQTNMTLIDSIKLRLHVSSDITAKNPARLRVYARVYNILRIASGISGLVYSNDMRI